MTALAPLFLCVCVFVCVCVCVYLLSTKFWGPNTQDSNNRIFFTFLVPMKKAVYISYRMKCFVNIYIYIYIIFFFAV